MAQEYTQKPNTNFHGETAGFRDPGVKRGNAHDAKLGHPNCQAAHKHDAAAKKENKLNARIEEEQNVKQTEAEEPVHANLPNKN